MNCALHFAAADLPSRSGCSPLTACSQPWRSVFAVKFPPDVACPCARPNVRYRVADRIVTQTIAAESAIRRRRRRRRIRPEGKVDVTRREGEVCSYYGSAECRRVRFAPWLRAVRALRRRVVSDTASSASEKTIRPSAWERVKQYYRDVRMGLHSRILKWSAPRGRWCSTGHVILLFRDGLFERSGGRLGTRVPPQML